MLFQQCAYVVAIVGVSIHEAARAGNVERIKELNVEPSSLIK